MRPSDFGIGASARCRGDQPQLLGRVRDHHSKLPGTPPDGQHALGAA
jgi:hypothetical protein